MDNTTFIFRKKELAEMLNFGTYYCESCKVSHTTSTVVSFNFIGIKLHCLMTMDMFVDT